eukprot:2290779-Prorocentrum_lima.AAC.1
MDGTVAAARELQRVQASMYIKASINSCVEQEKYEGSLKIMQALKERHGGELEFDIPDNVPSGLVSDAYRP